MKMVNLVDVKGYTHWFNADKVQKMDTFHDRENQKYETWIIFGEGLSSIKVYGNIPSVIRAIENQIEFPPEADYVGVAGDKYGAIG